MKQCSINEIKVNYTPYGDAILKAWNKPNKINLKFIQKTVDKINIIQYNGYVR